MLRTLVFSLFFFSVLVFMRVLGAGEGGGGDKGG